ncbi:Warthog protein 1 [Parelaphostrongylus tenuis]|uniref:Warthog protein 1 n=1 Tax=Parelaphostrongylus tenuis TaxID=148309 RepID=A0AAD5MCS5_PARTN|nr:Warthog protein 1 [Parelaphostrongylus tenuis]
MVGKADFTKLSVLFLGEVLRDGRQTGFDLISNVRKIDSEDESAYELTVVRMNCLPDPVETH